MEKPYITHNQFILLAWKGAANGAALTPLFDIALFQKRVLTIKRIYCRWYQTHASPSGNKGYLLSDDPLLTANLSDQSPEHQILPYDIADDFDNGMYPRLSVNGTRLTWFNTTEGLPINFDMDNLNVTYAAPLDSIEISIAAKIIGIVEPRDIITPNVKVVMEAYLDLYANR